MRIRHLLILALFLPSIGYAQVFSPEHVEWLPHSVGDKKWRPLVGFDSRRSFFQGRNVKFLGIRLGAEHRRVHRFGLAIFGLRDGDSFDDVVIDRADAPPGATADFNVSFVTLFYERLIMKERRWELSTPVYWGGGRLIGEYRNTAGNIRPYIDQKFSVFGGGFMIKYRLLPWLEPGIGGGYRHAFNSQREVKKTMQQPYYVVKVSILLGQLFRKVINNDPLEGE